MRRLPPRLFLTAMTAFIFLGLLIAIRPGFPGSTETPALIATASVFWIFFIIGTTITAIVYAILSLLMGVPQERIGMKDERDIATGNKAYAVGFWILFLGSFVTILSVGSDHNQMLVAAILTQVLAIGAILLIGLIDELRMARLAWKAD